MELGKMWNHLNCCWFFCKKDKIICSPGQILTVGVWCKYTCFLRERLVDVANRALATLPGHILHKNNAKKIQIKKEEGDRPLTITHKLNKTGKDSCLIQSQYELKCSSNLQKYSTRVSLFTTTWFWSLDPVQVCLGRLEGGGRGGVGKYTHKKKRCFKKKIRLN